MSKRLGGIKGCKYKTSSWVVVHTWYFIEDNTIQYSSAVVIIYDNTLHPMFTFFAFKSKKEKGTG